MPWFCRLVFISLSVLQIIILRLLFVPHAVSGAEKPVRACYDRDYQSIESLDIRMLTQWGN